MSFPWAQEYRPKSRFMRWLDDRLPLPRLVYGSVGGGYPVPRNLNYFWNFGVLAGVALMIQIVTGIVLAMHYVPSGAEAFNSTEHIMRDVNQGWLLATAAKAPAFFSSSPTPHLQHYYGLQAARERSGIGLVILRVWLPASWVSASLGR